GGLGGAVSFPVTTFSALSTNTATGAVATFLALPGLDQTITYPTNGRIIGFVQWRIDYTTAIAGAVWMGRILVNGVEMVSSGRARWGTGNLTSGTLTLGSQGIIDIAAST